MKYLFKYIVWGALAGVFFTLVYFFTVGTGTKTMQLLAQCTGAGAVGGMVGGILREVGRKNYIPFLQSWFMLILMIYIIGFLNSKTGVHILWRPFAYGYLAHLLYEAYHRKLPKI